MRLDAGPEQTAHSPAIRRLARGGAFGTGTSTTSLACDGGRPDWRPRGCSQGDPPPTRRTRARRGTAARISSASPPESCRDRDRRARRRDPGSGPGGRGSPASRWWIPAFAPTRRLVCQQEPGRVGTPGGCLKRVSPPGTTEATQEARRRACGRSRAWCASIANGRRPPLVALGKQPRLRPHPRCFPQVDYRASVTLGHFYIARQAGTLTRGAQNSSEQRDAYGSDLRRPSDPDVLPGDRTRPARTLNSGLKPVEVSMASSRRHDRGSMRSGGQTPARSFMQGDTVNQAGRETSRTAPWDVRPSETTSG